jgi:hypothetical protein
MPSILPIMRKRIEKYGKRLLQSLLGYWLGPRKGRQKPETIRRILIFRLDGRVGNGILLLPLAGAIAADPRPIEVDILINKKVADFFAAFGEQLFHRIWPWGAKAHITASVATLAPYPEFAKPRLRYCPLEYQSRCSFGVQCYLWPHHQLCLSGWLRPPGGT